jgi:carbonic anhydrase/acetyltransferase-like protein (isoleucine patch superfamily)
MPDWQLNTERPHIDPSVFVAPTATVIGDVSLGANASVWYGACVRADMASIRIGEGSNVQDNATLHVDPGVPTVIGRFVTIAHNAVVHGATVGDFSLIGMGAVVLNGAVIGEGSLIAAGAVVREGMQVPPGSLVAGVPGRVVRELSPEQADHLRHNAESYIACAQAHLAAQG